MDEDDAEDAMGKKSLPPPYLEAANGELYILPLGGRKCT